MQLHILYITKKDLLVQERAVHTAALKYLQKKFTVKNSHTYFYSYLFTSCCHTCNEQIAKQKTIGESEVKRWVSLVTPSILINLCSYRVRRLSLIKIIMGLIAKYILLLIVRSSKQLNSLQIITCLLLCLTRQINKHKHSQFDFYGYLRVPFKSRPSF